MKFPTNRTFHGNFPVSTWENFAKFNLYARMKLLLNKHTWESHFSFATVRGFILIAEVVGGASKIKVKNVNKKRMATARRLIFF